MDYLLCNTDALKEAAKKTIEIKMNSKNIIERMDNNIALLTQNELSGNEGTIFYNEYLEFKKEFLQFLEVYNAFNSAIDNFADEVESFDRKYSNIFAGI